MTRLYGLSKDQLKKLKKSGELTPIKLENGNWQFPVESVQLYLERHPRKSIKKQQNQDELSSSPIDSISREQTVLELLPKQVDIEPELLSKDSACSLFNLSSSQFDEIIKQPSVKIYRNKSYKAYNALEIQSAIYESALNNGAWSYRFTKCRDCKTITKEHYASGYCVGCYLNTTEYSVLNDYLAGESFADIGRRIGVSRERVRQLFEKSVRNEAENIIGSNIADDSDAIESIREAIKSEAKKNNYRKKYQNEIADALDQIDTILNSTSTSSSKTLLSRVGISSKAAFIIEEDYPEVARILFRNKTRWSTQHDNCVSCKTTQDKHQSNGLCVQCYRKSDTFRASQVRWRRDNYEKFRATQKRYEKEYYQRPEVKAKLKQKEYQKRFGSQIRRETAVKQYDKKCSVCGCTRREHIDKYSQDLSVLHLDGNLANNDISNLRPFCRSCAAKYRPSK